MSEIRVNTIKSENGAAPVAFDKGVNISGVATATGFVGDLTGDVTGDVTGALTGNASGTAGGLSGTPDITIQNITGVAGTFTGFVAFSTSISVGGTITYEDVTNVDSVGVVTARGGLEVGAAGVGGTISATGNAEFAGFTTISKLGGATEIVSVAATTNITTSKEVIMELDCSKGTVFTHDLEADGAVGIVSIKNFRVDTNSFTTATVIFTQRSSTPTGGVGNTFPTSLSGNPGGIGTNITLQPRNVAANAGISTNGRIGSATTVVLSSTAKDLDIVTFGIHYNGSGSGTAGNYRVVVSKSGDFRFGSVGF